MTDARKNVTVRIMNKDYTLRSSDDPEYLRSLATYVDGKMRGIAKGSVNMPLADAAILAALNMADELHRSQRKLAAVSSEDAQKGKVSAGKGGGDAAQWKQVHDRIQSILDLFPK
jgi:cell division protein ZapA